MTRPTDGGRGHEWRTRWTMLRLFSWRHGAAHHRGKRRFTSARWTVLSSDFVLIGVSTYEDEDGDRNVEFGLGVIWLGIHVTLWPREPSPADQGEGS